MTVTVRVRGMALFRIALAVAGLGVRLRLLSLSGCARLLNRMLPLMRVQYRVGRAWKPVGRVNGSIEVTDGQK